MFNKLAIPFALIALVVIGVLRGGNGDDPRVKQYQALVAQVINDIPIDANGWVGSEVALPQSATNLLRPNALMAREYVNDERGVNATLLIVQCADARDMAGHFPPRCYPANGWLSIDEDGPLRVVVDGHVMNRYKYHRVAGRNEREISVYNMFALPTGGTTTSMDDVYRLSADYQYRSFGAAQVQIVIDGGVDPDQHEWILNEMYAIVAPAVERVRSIPAVDALGEGTGS